jgi:hypothetical protein
MKNHLFKKENERLGMRRIMEFNLALFGKWCSRLKEECVSLWYKVLAAQYGRRGKDR